MTNELIGLRETRYRVLLHELKREKIADHEYRHICLGQASLTGLRPF